MEDADYFEGSAAEWGNEADGGTVSTCGRLSGGAGLPSRAAGAGGWASGLKRPVRGSALPPRRSGERRASPEGRRLFPERVPEELPGPAALREGGAASGAPS